MALTFEVYSKGCKAEAIDDDGVWCPCTVVKNEKDALTVSFDGWNSQWNRTIRDQTEIRERSSASYANLGKRKRKSLSSKVGILVYLVS